MLPGAQLYTIGNSITSRPVSSTTQIFPQHYLDMRELRTYTGLLVSLLPVFASAAVPTFTYGPLSVYAGTPVSIRCKQ